MDPSEPDIVAACRADHLDSVRDLLGDRNDVSDLCVNGTSLLHLAVLYGSEDIAKYAIEHGADVNVATEAGCTPLHWVARTDLDSVAQLLLERNAEVNAITADTGETPYDLAIGSGRKEMAALLHSHGGTHSPQKDETAEADRIKAVLAETLRQIEYLTNSVSTEDERFDVEYGVGEVSAAIFRLTAKLDELDDLDRKEAIGTLVDLLDYDYQYVREAAVKRLGRMRSHDAIPAVIRALDDDSTRVVDSAISALGQIGAREAVSPLIAALSDSSSFDRAAQTLGLIGDRAAVKPLLRALEDRLNDEENDSQNTRDIVVIIESIGALGDQTLADTVAKFLESEDYHIKNATLRALIRIGNSGCVSAVQSIYEDATEKGRNEDSTRALAIGALCSCGEPSLVNDLLEKLKAELSAKAPDNLDGGDHELRYGIARALGATGNERCCDFAFDLVEELYEKVGGDLNPASQTVFPQVLATIGTARAVGLLREILLDKNSESEIRDAAAEAMVEIGGPEAVEALSFAVRNTQPDLFTVEYDVEKAHGWSAIEEIMPDSYYVALRYLDDLGYDHGITPAVKSRVVKKWG